MKKYEGFLMKNKNGYMLKVFYKEKPVETNELGEEIIPEPVKMKDIPESVINYLYDVQLPIDFNNFIQTQNLQEIIDEIILIDTIRFPKLCFQF